MMHNALISAHGKAKGYYFVVAAAIMRGMGTFPYGADFIVLSD
jgi:hypothetical protein